VIDRPRKLVDAMQTLTVRIASTAALTSLMLFLSTGVSAAGAPSVTGQTYGDASAALSSAGFTATVATTVGDRLPKEKCLVVGQRNESVAQNGSHSTGGKTVAVSLNCDNQQASATKPGFSAASPEGRAAKAAAAASAAAQPTP
jgi:hypothetical protein